MQIAIDGPSGAGKSTIAKKLAKILKFQYLDTGAMYRTLALYFDRNNFNDFDNEDKLKKFLEGIVINVKEDKFYLFDEDVTSLIRSEKIGMLASKVSSYKTVREFLVAIQQKLASGKNIILDGRDIGTVVLKDAELKIYLVAGLEERAIRRYKQLLESNKTCDFKEVIESIKKRDFDDINRENSPLKKADDAVVIDSSNLTLDETVETILDLIEED